MYPNPQDALPLPERPDIEHYRKLAKELVKACKLGQISEWTKRWNVRYGSAMEEFAKTTLERGERTCVLADAQFVIARAHGFESWPKFAKHLEAIQKRAVVSRFEEAAEAIVSGDLARLQELLREDPELVRTRSTREHGATLLHYVAANGVENYRQKTPPNIVQIADTLLKAGAEIDATANMYGGGCTTLGLAATSVHPERAGVQEALLEKLLEHGADPKLRSGGNRHSLVSACLANGQPKAARFLADRGAELDFAGAAGIGRIEAVEKLFDAATEAERKEALLYASGYGPPQVMEFLLARGADLTAHWGDGQTPAHLAVIGGSLETLRLLLANHAALESTNAYGGTVLGQALWSAAHGGDPETYIKILEALMEAGANIPDRHIPVNPRVDEWLARHGSVAEPSWYWFGEKPPT